MNNNEIVLVGCISSYREGPLIQEAIDSLLPHVDEILVHEGPVGDLRLPDAPRSEIRAATVTHGEWESDAAKRTAMLNLAKLRHPKQPLWLFWLDGDETLENGAYLRGLARYHHWNDDHNNASLDDDDNPPTGGVPVKVVDLDGNVVSDRGRLINAHLIRRMIVANLIVELVNGVEIRLGHVPLTIPDLPQVRAVEILKQRLHGALTPEQASQARRQLDQIAAQVMLLPPLPGEPFIVHRAHLRHPARQQHRLHQDEHAELERLGLPTGEQ